MKQFLQLAGIVMTLLDHVSACESINSLITSESTKTVRHDSLDKMVNGVHESVSDADKSKLSDLLFEYHAAFSLNDTDVGRTPNP